MVGSGVQMSVAAMKEKPEDHQVGMVVDDDAMVRESVAAVLEDVCDEVYQAGDGLEGLEVLDAHSDISLIITDIAMPRLDGLAFADAISSCTLLAATLECAVSTCVQVASIATGAKLLTGS